MNRSFHALESASGLTSRSPSGDAGSRRGKSRWIAALTLTLAPLLGVSSACLDRPIGRPDPVTTNIFVDRITQTSVDKIDLLFMIDNSQSMSDKQEILRLAVPDLVNRLVNPICVDSMGGQFPPPPPGGLCPQGQSQEFNPIKDIHIGVVSSSLGDVGANVACPQQGNQEYLPDRIDLAHLMGSLTRGTGTANTDQGFLAWSAGSTVLEDFNRSFQRMVQSVGEKGCGWEASLESWYRFLVDPYPYKELVRVTCAGSMGAGQNCVQQATDGEGRILVDQVLLDQRAAFLRPDSLVAVVMLSDENDCSMQVGNQTWVVASINAGRQPMFRGSSTCEQDPNNKCCYSCPLGPPSGCSADPICQANPAEGSLLNRLPAVKDGENLRCYQQKRRFGVDFLYPTRRYVNALTNSTICWNKEDLDVDGCADGNVVTNPLYAGGRVRNLVFFGGIIGVPWQAIAATVDSNNRPLAAGQLRFQSAAELQANGTWDQILGSPGVAWRAADGSQPEVAGVPGIKPATPQMIESEFPRPGVTDGNPINGREYNTADTRTGTPIPSDLEYSCIFPLAEPVNCAQLAPELSCDCRQGDNGRPLCEQQPGSGTPPGTTQYWAKAYPGGRHLEVLKEYGDNSIVASICAKNVTDNTRSDFGYRPAIAAIVDRLKEQLGNRCLPRALLTNPADGTVSCNLVEAIARPEGPCNCDAAIARRDPSSDLKAVVQARLAEEPGDACGADDPNCTGACLCEVLQVQQAGNPANALEACQNDETVSGVEGWCYVDADQGVGNEALVETCPATQRRLLRFVGRGLQSNTTTFVSCTGSNPAD